MPGSVAPRVRTCRREAAVHEPINVVRPSPHRHGQASERRAWVLSTPPRQRKRCPDRPVYDSCGATHDWWKGRAVSYTAADITELDDVQHTRPAGPAVKPRSGRAQYRASRGWWIKRGSEEVARCRANGRGPPSPSPLHADGSVRRGRTTGPWASLPVDSDPVNGKENGIVQGRWVLRRGGRQVSPHTPDAAGNGPPA